MCSMLARRGPCLVGRGVGRYGDHDGGASGSACGHRLGGPGIAVDHFESARVPQRTDKVGTLLSIPAVLGDMSGPATLVICLGECTGACGLDQIRSPLDRSGRLQGRSLFQSVPSRQALPWQIIHPSFA